MVSAERQLRELSRGAVGEHLICSLMLLRFLPMRSGSQQCVNVVQRVPTFTAITRVQIPSGTPEKISSLQVEERWPETLLEPCFHCPADNGGVPVAPSSPDFRLNSLLRSVHDSKTCGESEPHDAFVTGGCISTETWLAGCDSVLRVWSSTIRSRMECSKAARVIGFGGF